jgi:hypothetical protein
VLFLLLNVDWGQRGTAFRGKLRGVQVSSDENAFIPIPLSLHLPTIFDWGSYGWNVGASSKTCSARSIFE